MVYRNTVTGAIIDSPCIISGGDWELQESETTEEAIEEPKTEEKPVEEPKRTRRTKKEEK